MNWHPLRTNPLDHIGETFTGEGGATIKLTYAEPSPRNPGGFGIDISGPVTRNLRGLSNIDACGVLNTWNAH